MGTILCFQHVQCEPPGLIADAIAVAGHTLRVVRSFAGEPVPGDFGGTAGLVVMGGPMGVYDGLKFPFLTQELRLIEQALRTQTPVLGVCLGSQLLASALGAPVTPGQRKEIGWHPVHLTESAHDDTLWSGIDSPFTAFHWHGDVFPLPASATTLASSALTKVQAFRYGPSAYGLLFHLEVTLEMIGEMVRTFAGELAEEGIDGAAIEREAAERLPALNTTGQTVFGRWAALIPKE